MEGSRSSRLDDAFDDSFTDEPPPDEQPARNPLDPLLAQLGALREEVVRYLSARSDQLKLSVRNFALWLLLALVAGLAAITVLLTAVALIVVGVANLLAVATGLPLGAGQLIIGGTIVAAFSGGMALVVYGIRKSSRERTIAKYEGSRNPEHHDER